VEPPRDDFADLLQRVRAGDEAAARSIFETHQPRLLRFLRATEPRVADDLASEVWVAVVQGFERFEGEADDFRAWIFAIARRRVADHRRRGVRRQVAPEDPTIVTQAIDAGAASDDLANGVVNGLTAQRAVDEIVAQLSPDQAEVLLMRVLGDLSVADVATILGRPASWVRVTQHRALERLSRRAASKFVVAD
jgi:RNA polymerase sigma-70 factor (ECF subfamily)